MVVQLLIRYFTKFCIKLQSSVNMLFKLQIRLSNDSVNGVSLHNRLPILAASTGQHRNTDEYLQNEQNDNSITYWWYGATGQNVMC